MLITNIAIGTINGEVVEVAINVVMKLNTPDPIGL
jgi:hypothetical protein